MEEVKHMDQESEDLVVDRIKQLTELFPEVATEGDGSIDFEKLRLILGDEVDEGDERYSFTWPGKADAIRQAQKMSTATLHPCPEKSVDWDTTQNLYIEGDNLEVLKLLQRSYHGKVKMIYIDPPYNTGHDFVYHDSFGDSIENYREQAGLSGQSNADTSGRYHSNWCSMIYPRLKLARELLADDGAIFISIDDTEQANLKTICDEIFGNNNFLAQIVWERAYAPVNLKKHFSNSHDYILCYAKNSERAICNGLPRSQAQDKDYRNLDNDPRGPWKPGNPSVGPAVEKNIYEITSPSGRKMLPPSGRSWLYSKEKFQEMLDDNRIYWGRDGNSVWAPKMFLSEVKQGVTPMTIWKYNDVGHSQSATKALKELFDGKAYFEYPKPVNLIKRCIQLYSDGDSIVLDFFSGSGSLAQAVMENNVETNSKDRFILVQLPEKTAHNSLAFRDGITDLCELGEERIRRAGKKIVGEIEELNRQLKLGEEPKKVPDIGFRVLKLDDSGIARPEPGQLVLDRVKPGRTDEDIVFEMMLKWGLELTYPIEKTEIGGYPCYSVAGDALICCMQEGLTVEAIQAIADRLPSRVLMLDSVLDDTLKLNAVQIFKHVEEKNQVTIDLRTV